MAEIEEYQLNSEKQIVTHISDKDITQLLNKCGNFGPYQRYLYSCVFMTCMLAAMPGMNLVFISSNVSFLCYPPNFNISVIPQNLTENEYLQMLQPDDDKCSVYNSSFTETYYTELPSNLSKLKCSYGRKFLTEKFSTIVSEYLLPGIASIALVELYPISWLEVQESLEVGFWMMQGGVPLLGSHETILGVGDDVNCLKVWFRYKKEFDLVCERQWLKSTLQSVYFVGYLVGSIVFGALSDRFGRRPIFFLSNTILVVFGIIKIYVPSLIMVMIAYCIQAFGIIGISLINYSMTLEYTSSTLRTPVNFSYMCMFGIGMMFLTGLAYTIPDWHYLELTVCLLPIINVFIGICIPESPRWLIGRKRFEEAKAHFRKVMKKNKIQSHDILDIFPTNEKSSFENGFPENIREKNVLPKEKNYSFIDLFKTFRLATITINICFSWMVISMLYYGVTLNSVDMAGNRYINFLLMGVVELPSNLCSYYLFTRFDHRKPISFFMMFSGLNCIVSNFVTKGSFWFPLILVVLGKFGISAAFNSVYLLSAEIFPTVVRTNGLGIASLTARIGGICAPFILQLSSFFKWLPLSVYGILSVISGLLLLLLPETKDRDLPQTFEDLENWKT